jgi:signal transduction histidine kinase
LRPSPRKSGESSTPTTRASSATRRTRRQPSSPPGAKERLWGAAVAGASECPLPQAAEERISNFAELVATAISNADTRAELTASKARVVAAADEPRRRLERDLHDGIQQRLVSLALRARAAELAAGEAEDELSFLADDLGAVLSRGIHPAILSEAGLRPALKALARRSTVPVALELHLDSRLEEVVEAAAYYVVSEALTNTVKHAEASMIELRADYRDGALTLVVRDDGVGGAHPGRGSGLLGLTDRVAALGGRITVTSPSGAGTTLVVRIPAKPSPSGALTRFVSTVVGCGGLDQAASNSGAASGARSTSAAEGFDSSRTAESTAPRAASAART